MFPFLSLWVNLLSLQDEKLHDHHHRHPDLSSSVFNTRGYDFSSNGKPWMQSFAEPMTCCSRIASFTIGSYGWLSTTALDVCINLGHSSFFPLNFPRGMIFSPPKVNCIVMLVGNLFVDGGGSTCLLVGSFEACLDLEGDGCGRFGEGGYGTSHLGDKGVGNMAE